MKIQKYILIEKYNTLFISFAVSLSIFVFAYNYNFGPISILLYYFIWLPVLILIYQRLIYFSIFMLPLFIFSILVLLSFLWSDVGGLTLRGAIQLWTHLICALLAAHVVTVRSFTYGAVIGTLIVTCYSLANPRFSYDVFGTSYAFLGAFGSKNQLGFFTSVGIFFSFYWLVFFSRWTSVRIFLVAVILLYIYVLKISQSVTSIISISLVIALVTGLIATRFTNPIHRKIIFTTLLLSGVTFVYVLTELDFFAHVLTFFGKDTTLTGRTYLWAQGIDIGLRSPVLGVGYNAFWSHGIAEAERLWAEFYITGRTGFHFHNTYIECLVTLGIAGLGSLLVMMALTIWRIIILLLNERNTTEAICFCGVMTLLVIRSFFEVDILTPYSLGSFLLYYIAGKTVLTIHNRAPRKNNNILPMAANLEASRS